MKESNVPELGPHEAWLPQPGPNDGGPTNGPGSGEQHGVDLVKSREFLSSIGNADWRHQFLSTVVAGETGGGGVIIDASRLPGHGFGITLSGCYAALERAKAAEIALMLHGGDDLVPVGMSALYSDDRAAERLQPTKLIGQTDDRAPITLDAMWGTGEQWLCGVSSSNGGGSGALVGPRHVLTAAHCIAGASASELSVTIGEFAWASTDAPASMKPPVPGGLGLHWGRMLPPIKVAKVFAPKYFWDNEEEYTKATMSRRELAHDIAVLVLEETPSPAWAYGHILTDDHSAVGVPKRLALPTVGSGTVFANPREWYLDSILTEGDLYRPWSHFHFANYSTAWNGTDFKLNGLVWYAGTLNQPVQARTESGTVQTVDLVHEGACLLRHTLDTTGGMSGGPLWRVQHYTDATGTKKARALVVGVNVGEDDKWTYNYAASGSEMVTCINAALAAWPP